MIVYKKGTPEIGSYVLNRATLKTEHVATNKFTFGTLFE
jgi:hypothetical protein